MSGDNPFQPPSSNLAGEQAVADQPRLYSMGSVGLATFFGSPLAGGFIIAQNLKALGRGAETGGLWGTAIGIFVVCMALAFILPEDVPTMVFTFAQLGAMVTLAQFRIGPALVLHGEQQGPFHSKWRAVGVGVLFGLGIVAALVLLAIPLYLAGYI